MTFHDHRTHPSCSGGALLLTIARLCERGQPPPRPGADDESLLGRCGRRRVRYQPHRSHTAPTLATRPPWRALLTTVACARGTGIIPTPEVSFRSLDRSRDKFIVLASDGLWEFLSNQACNLAHISPSVPFSRLRRAVGVPLQPGMQSRSHLPFRALLSPSTGCGRVPLTRMWPASSKHL